MSRSVRLAACCAAAAAVLLLLACAPGPWGEATATPAAGATPTRHVIESAAETATARAGGQGLGGGIGKATATLAVEMTESADQTPAAADEGWRDNLPDGENLLPVPPLAQGIDAWDLWLQPGSYTPGANEVFMAEDAEYGPVVVFSRQCNCSDGGAAGLILKPEISVRGWEHLYVWLVAKVDWERGGNLANSNPRWYPEGAVQVRLAYTAVGGGDAEWYHGFCYSDVEGADSEHFSRVGEGRWFTYLSDDLTQISPRPATINEVRVYGFGWEFGGMVAEFALVGSPSPAR